MRLHSAKSMNSPPYCAYLFRIGRRTQYWIIYTVDENRRMVDVRTATPTRPTCPTRRSRPIFQNAHIDR